ncbi:cap-specific mRNA (nucleoside-2'-O-)-methyltransferase 1 [Malaya genurostris]|uniref:cap-specific mRNA (nucleoside-2'-O-)-methyltransferase 1 n=1 Tax=Malaya genurostris TaxID=325434 RepID=UPI0026F408ED|nr:cap-specific mRNA (nucleoside-2'-O-)-methyltransferase 1 [Malaya genurostris]
MDINNMNSTKLYCSESDNCESDMASNLESCSNKCEKTLKRVAVFEEKFSSKMIRSQQCVFAADSVKSSKSIVYSEQSMRMMDKMKYDKSRGLGRSGQGRTDIVQIVAQKGRRGLGLKLDELDTAASSWDVSLERIDIPEEIHWLENKNQDVDDWNIDLLKSWIKLGKRNLNISGEDQFCQKNVLNKILECKTAFDKLDAKEMRKARAKSNPFEAIKSNIFMNRAAVKMANLDSMFEYMFTNPVDESGNSLVGSKDLLYFADVCAGPGGFSEYFLWRKKWEAKGFGFTLRGENDFKLHDFIAGTPETFDTYYGPKNNGDIFDLTNIDGFTKYIMNQTEFGVHVMMADGGFSVEGNENAQEILSKQLYLCEILVALNIVRTSGHFVVKLFDLFTPFSVGLIYLAYKSFKKICICKPNTSRPANSERYLVCKWKKARTDIIAQHLYEVNKLLMNQNEETDVIELVPFSMMKEDNDFFQYVYNSNNELGQKQIVGLLKIAAFSANEELVENKQNDIKIRCLQLWNLEDNLRKVLPKPSNEHIVNNLLKEWVNEKLFLSAPEEQLNSSKLEQLFPSVHGWYFVPLDNTENTSKNFRTLFIGKGGKEVLQYNSIKHVWSLVKDVYLELPSKTLLYGEIVKELQGEGRSQISINTFHIIDGIILGGKDIRKWPLRERLKICAKFAMALSKPLKTVKNMDSTHTVTMPIRSKKLFALSDLELFFNQLVSYKLKGGEIRLGYHLRNSNEPARFYVPRALLFLNEIRDDFLKVYSKSQSKFYYYCKKRQISLFPEQMKCTDETIASFKNTYIHRIIWKWQHTHQVLHEDDMEKISKDPNMIYRMDINHYLAYNKHT